MRPSVDILENEIVKDYPDVLKILLRDHTTQKNIFWATDNYEYLGEPYSFNSQILPELITGENGNIIMPRVYKDKLLQQSRSKQMAEVFTPSWICNAQNNLIDNAWFGRQNAFNFEVFLENGSFAWKVNKEKILFPKEKTWKDYVMDARLEIACGEAPYITSRYDSISGEFIPVENRIGILDRKLRVINENVHSTGEWLKSAQNAFKNTYAFEWQGDSLLLAREAMLLSFIENFMYKFNKEPLLKSIQYIAYIISWNVWQMDALKAVIPNSCGPTITSQITLFDKSKSVSLFCEGCLENNINKHTGTRCIIKDWSTKDLKTKKMCKKIEFVKLLNKVK